MKPYQWQNELFYVLIKFDYYENTTFLYFFSVFDRNGCHFSQRKYSQHRENFSTF